MRVCVCVPLSAQTCNDPVVIRHTHSAWKEEWGRQEGNRSRGGGRALHGALFSKSTPSLELGESLFQRSRVSLEAFLLFSAVPYTFIPRSMYRVLNRRPAISYGMLLLTLSVQFTILQRHEIQWQATAQKEKGQLFRGETTVLVWHQYNNKSLVNLSCRLYIDLVEFFLFGG